MQPPLQFAARSVDDFVHFQTPAAYCKRIIGRLFLVTPWDMANLIFTQANAAAVVDEEVRWRNLIPNPLRLTSMPLSFHKVFSGQCFKKPPLRGLVLSN